MYDLAIIGAGAGGIAGAKQAVRYGLKTVLLERSSSLLGGVCLNRGCIPTKFFSNFSKLNQNWQSLSEENKKNIDNIKLSLLKYLENKGLEIKWGEVVFEDKNVLKINNEQIIEAKNIIIATGSLPKRIIEHKKAIVCEDIFNLSSLPKKLLIVGGGYTGIEFASLLKNFGCEVLVVEKEEYIVPFFDNHLSNRLRVILSTREINIHTGKAVSDYNFDDYDIVILSTGREPDTERLGIDKIGLETKDGWIKTDKFLRTNIDNIYACGDVTGKKLLAYIAEYQAEVCIDNIMGRKTEENYQGIPECVFSFPQMAKVGILEEEAKVKNLKYKVIKSNFLKFSSSYVYGDTDGFIQIFIDDRDTIIGAGIISNYASELISIFSLCIRNNLKSNDLKKCVFPHPTLSEIIPLLLRQT